MPKLAGIFTRILLIIRVKPPEELFAYLLLLLFAVGGWGETEYNEETHNKDFFKKKETNKSNSFRNFQPPLWELSYPWVVGSSVRR